MNQEQKLLEAPKVDKNAHLKEKFLTYFRQLPIQKLAAAHIGKAEDTITDWKAQDSDFSDQIDMARAEWALKNVKSVRSKEWLLERLMRDTFRPPEQKTDVTLRVPQPIFGGQSKNALPEGNSDQ